MSLVEKIVYVVLAAIIISYLPSFFEIDQSAQERPAVRTYKIFNHIITVSKIEGEDNE